MRILRDDALLLVVDVQEKLVPVVHASSQLLDQLHRLIEGMKLLQVPILISEQYPKGLGPTIGSVKERLPETAVLPKLAFSCWDDPGLRGALEASGRKTIVLCGVEAHVCVLQTVLDLAAAGFVPVVAADAVSSRNPDDVARAAQRMAAEGAIVTGVESLLFELTRTAGTEVFRSLSRLVK